MTPRQLHPPDEPPTAADLRANRWRGRVIWAFLFFIAAQVVALVEPKWLHGFPVVPISITGMVVYIGVMIATRRAMEAADTRSWEERHPY